MTTPPTTLLAQPQNELPAATNPGHGLLCVGINPVDLDIHALYPRLAPSIQAATVNIYQHHGGVDYFYSAVINNVLGQASVLVGLLLSPSLHEASCIRFIRLLAATLSGKLKLHHEAWGTLRPEDRMRTAFACATLLHFMNIFPPEILYLWQDVRRIHSRANEILNSLNTEMLQNTLAKMPVFGWWIDGRPLDMVEGALNVLQSVLSPERAALSADLPSLEHYGLTAAGILVDTEVALMDFIQQVESQHILVHFVIDRRGVAGADDGSASTPVMWSLGQTRVFQFEPLTHPRLTLEALQILYQQNTQATGAKKNPRIHYGQKSELLELFDAFQVATQKYGINLAAPPTSADQEAATRTDSDHRLFSVDQTRPFEGMVQETLGLKSGLYEFDVCTVSWDQ
ncbi:hypothetical protein H696_01337 [Fonticula alba]|uniref:Uncharacterized protein n=1 Tax=Fonticula alba TaxID=691883 RepID=A0A058ZDC1_FONAL|nr:hypothetical protein H696_01337 [Fonticula alba]KCV71928.1 hypothetical protein H696_01337 [Fonticula alba]|eukprot:XP_009493506.1 hypothetical protein H696_01337 [Fonticula alba]